MSAVVGVNNQIFTVSENVGSTITSGSASTENADAAQRRFKVRKKLVNFIYLHFSKNK